MQPVLLRLAPLHGDGTKIRLALPAALPHPQPALNQAAILKSIRLHIGVTAIRHFVQQEVRLFQQLNHRMVTTTTPLLQTRDDCGRRGIVIVRCQRGQQATIGLYAIQLHLLKNAPYFGARICFAR